MHPRCIYCLKKLEKLSVKCEQCENIVLCIHCFSYGAEAGPHKRSHKYVLQQYAGSGKERELFNSAWAPDIELALLDCIAACGLGNWNDVASKLAPLSPAECRTHYESIYLSGPLSALLRCNWPKIQDHNSNDPHSLISEDFPPKHAPSPEECKMLGYMPKRDDFECEFNNDAENCLSKIRVELISDPLFWDLIVAKVEMFVERLRERRQCRLLASRLDMLTHFLPSLRKVTACAMLSSSRNNNQSSHRLTWLSASPIPAALRLNSQSDTRHALVIGSNTTGRKRGRRKRTCTDTCSRTQFNEFCVDKLDQIPKLTNLPILSDAQPVEPRSQSTTSVTDEVCLKESPVKLEIPHSFPINETAKSEIVYPDSVFSKDSALSSVEFHDSGVGSSECSLHSTTSYSNADVVGGMSISNNINGCKPSPILEENSTNVSCATPFPPNSPPSSLKRRYSHPFISPRLLRSESVSSMAGCSVSRRRMSASPFVTSFSKYKMTRAYEYRIRRKKDSMDYIPPPPSCCSPRSISEQLKPLLRFLTSSEAQLLLADLHNEHVLRQEIEQLHHLQLSGFTNLNNVRLAGAQPDVPDSDSSSDTEMKLLHEPKLMPRSSSNKEMKNNSAASPSCLLPARRPRGRPRLHNLGSRGGKISTTIVRKNGLKLNSLLSSPPAPSVCPVDNER